MPESCIRVQAKWAVSVGLQNSLHHPSDGAEVEELCFGVNARHYETLNILSKHGNNCIIIFGYYNN